MESERIRVAPVAPSHCSSCFQQKPTMRHIDFGAAWDGPVLPDEHSNIVGIVGATIDDLIICEDCLRIAGERIGLIDASELRALAVLEQANGALHQRVEQLEAHVANLEAARATREQIGTLPVPRVAKPRPERPGPQPKPKGQAKPKGQPRGRQAKAAA